jgi:hypothetical protein
VEQHQELIASRMQTEYFIPASAAHGTKIQGRKRHRRLLASLGLRSGNGPRKQAPERGLFGMDYGAAALGGSRKVHSKPY